MGPGSAHPAVHAPPVADGLGGEDPGDGAAGRHRPRHGGVGLAGHHAPLAGVGIDAGDLQRVGGPAARARARGRCSGGWRRRWGSGRPGRRGRSPGPWPGSPSVALRNRSRARCWLGRSCEAGARAETRAGTLDSDGDLGVEAVQLCRRPGPRPPSTRRRCPTTRSALSKRMPVAGQRAEVGRLPGDEEQPAPAEAEPPVDRPCRSGRRRPGDGQFHGRGGAGRRRAWTTLPAAGPRHRRTGSGHACPGGEEAGRAEQCRRPEWPHARSGRRGSGGPGLSG